MTNTTPSGADARDLLLTFQSWIGPRRPERGNPDEQRLWDRIDAAIAALSAAQEAPAQAAQAVPQGWALVPVEPTIAMCMAGDAARLNTEDATRSAPCYRAMLAAAPAAPQPAAQQGEIARPAIPATVRRDVTMLAGYAEGSKSAEIVNTVRRVIDWLNADRIAAQAQEAAQQKGSGNGGRNRLGAVQAPAAGGVGMSTKHTPGRTQWMKLRCDASLQSPTAYGSNAYRVEPPPAPEGKTRCPVCWKPVKLMQRSGFGGRRIPTHNYDHEMVLQKEAAIESARRAAMQRTTGREGA